MSDFDPVITALIGESRLDSNATAADQEALQALRRNVENPTEVLARYIRETMFIHPIVRKHLANALNGGSVYGTRLVMQGGGSIRDESKALEARYEWLKIGRWIEDRRAEGSTRPC